MNQSDCDVVITLRRVREVPDLFNGLSDNLVELVLVLREKCESYEVRVKVEEGGK